MLTRSYLGGPSKAGILREVQPTLSFTPNSKVVNPFKDLPNISSLKLHVNREDPLLLKHSVTKKLDPSIIIHTLSWRTKAANRYMRIMHYRLSKMLLEGNLVGFWILALMLMRRSMVLRCLALRKLNLNWHREFTLSTIKKILAELDVKIDSLSTKLNIKRRYEFKMKGGVPVDLRPIGNPSYADRMYLYIWQCFIVMMFSEYISKHQHAYRPGKGVVSALADLKAHLADKEYKYVWEFDLKGAFPSVFIPKAMESLREVGVPDEIVRWIEETSLTTIEEVDLKKSRDQGLRVTRFQRVPEVSFERKFVRQDNIRQGPLPRFAKIGREIELSFERSYNHQPIEFKGFPQGSGVSPILFNFVFEVGALRGHFLQLNPDCKVISYADDFLVFSKTPMPNIMDASDVMLQHGLTFNLEKSRRLMEDGVWLTTDFKFLGVTFNTVGGLSITGTPRSGKVLPFDKESMVQEFAARNLQLAELGRPVGLSPNVLLALWGQGVEPIKGLPFGFIKGDVLLSEDEMKSFSSVLQGSSKDLEKYKDDDSKFTGDWDPSETGTPSGEVNVSDLKPGNISRAIESLQKEGNLAFLGMQLDGVIINRLHGGDWNPEVDPAQRNLFSKERSWLQLKNNTVNRCLTAINPVKTRLNANWEAIKFFRDNLSIYNSTSLATVDLLRYGRNPKVLKVRHSELLHSVL